MKIGMLQYLEQGHKTEISPRYGHLLYLNVFSSYISSVVSNMMMMMMIMTLCFYSIPACIPYLFGYKTGVFPSLQ